jgi:TRAP-type uncharacterized transport system fused permease subunit
LNRINPVSFFSSYFKIYKENKKMRGEGCHTSDLVAQKNTRGGRGSKRKMSIVVLIFLLIFQYNTTSTTTTTMTAVARGNICTGRFFGLLKMAVQHTGVADLVSFAKPLPSILNTRKEKKEKKERRSLYNPWPHLHPIAAIQWKAAPAASQPRRGSRCNPSFRYVCVCCGCYGRVCGWMDG